MSEPTTSTTPPPGEGPTGEISFQIAIDCDDPHAEARFWAAALGYEVEVTHDFVQSLLDKGWVAEDDVVRIDDLLYFRTAVGIRRAGATKAEATASGGRLLFQKVPETKTVKDRIHLDLRTEDRVREVERLKGLGATVLYEHDEKDGTWTTMASPEGHEFCVS